MSRPSGGRASTALSTRRIRRRRRRARSTANSWRRPSSRTSCTLAMLRDQQHDQAERGEGHHAADVPGSDSRIGVIVTPSRGPRDGRRPGGRRCGPSRRAPLPPGATEQRRHLAAASRRCPRDRALRVGTHTSTGPSGEGEPRRRHADTVRHVVQADRCDDGRRRQRRCHRRWLMKTRGIERIVGVLQQPPAAGRRVQLGVTTRRSRRAWSSPARLKLHGRHSTIAVNVRLPSRQSR